VRYRVHTARRSASGARSLPFSRAWRDDRSSRVDPDRFFGPT
jgi:hypothetical protein